jgi:hypothetical protein
MCARAAAARFERSCAAASAARLLALLVMLAATQPLLGLVVERPAAGDGPEITLDICHPSQSIDSSAPIILVRPETRPNASPLICSGEIYDLALIFVPAFLPAPDPPPPKVRA